MQPATATAVQPNAAQELRRAACVIVFGVLSTSLAQTYVLGHIPLQNLLKNTLHVDRGANAEFFFWTIFPWYFKPLIGILSDALPLFGSRRKSYMLIGASMATACWFLLSNTSHQYGPLLSVCILINIGMVMTSTVVGGFMVETARATSGTGRLTSLRNFADQLSSMIAGPLGGLLASVAFGLTTVTCGCIAFLIVPVALWVLREPYRQPTAAELLRDARTQLSNVLRAKSLWAAAGVAGLFYCAPGIQTAIFYAQQNDLHLGTRTQGYLSFLQGLFGAAGAALYGVYLCRRLTLRSLLVICLLLGTAGNFAYLFYSSFRNAQIIDGFWGFGFTLSDVALMHLAVRATPAGSEALGFSLMMAVRNLGLYGSDWFGSSLLDRFHISLGVLVMANGLTSLLAVPLVLLLPAIIVNVRDTRSSPAAAVPTPAPALRSPSD